MTYMYIQIYGIVKNALEDASSMDRQAVEIIFWIFDVTDDTFHYSETHNSNASTDLQWQKESRVYGKRLFLAGRLGYGIKCQSQGI